MFIKLPICNKDFIITEKFLNVIAANSYNFYNNDEFMVDIDTNIHDNLMEVNYIKIFNMFVGRSYNEVAKNISFTKELSSIESFFGITFITDIKFDEVKRQYIIKTRYNLIIFNEFMNPIKIGTIDDDESAPLLRVNYEYDEQNRLKRRCIFDVEDLEISQTVYYEYNDITNTLEKVIKIIAPRCSTITKYDIHGRMISHVYYNDYKNDYMFFVHRYYHDNDNAVEQISNNTRSIRYYYDNAELIINRSANSLTISEIFDIDERFKVRASSCVYYGRNNIKTTHTLDSIIVTKFGVYDSHIDVIYDENNKKYTVKSKSTTSIIEFFLDENDVVYRIKRGGSVIYKDNRSISKADSDV